MLRFSVATLFRSWLASLAVGLRTRFARDAILPFSVVFLVNYLLVFLKQVRIFPASFLWFSGSLRSQLWFYVRWFWFNFVFSQIRGFSLMLFGFSRGVRTSETDQHKDPIYKYHKKLYLHRLKCYKDHIGRISKVYRVSCSNRKLFPKDYLQWKNLFKLYVRSVRCAFVS